MAPCELGDSLFAVTKFFSCYEYGLWMWCYPFTFSFIVPDEVQEFFEPECIMRTSQNVDITFHWGVSKQWLSLSIKM